MVALVTGKGVMCGKLLWNLCFKKDKLWLRWIYERGECSWISANGSSSWIMGAELASRDKIMDIETWKKNRIKGQIPIIQET